MVLSLTRVQAPKGKLPSVWFACIRDWRSSTQGREAQGLLSEWKQEVKSLQRAFLCFPLSEAADSCLCCALGPPCFSSLQTEGYHSWSVAVLSHLASPQCAPSQLQSQLDTRTFPPWSPPPAADHGLQVPLLKFLGNSLLWLNPTKRLVSLRPGIHPSHSSLSRAAVGRTVGAKPA